MVFLFSPLKTDRFLTFFQAAHIESESREAVSQYPGAKVDPGLKAEYESRREQIWI